MAKPPSSTLLPLAKLYHSSTTGLPGRGHSRVKGDGNVDIKLLSQLITFPFSGRTAPNRVLKSPMTEHLFHWSNEDIMRCGVPSPKLINPIANGARAGLRSLFRGTRWYGMTLLKRWGNPIPCDDHGGRLEKYRELVGVARRHGSLSIAQLSRPGRQVGKALNLKPVSAS